MYIYIYIYIENVGRVDFEIYIYIYIYMQAGEVKDSRQIHGKNMSVTHRINHIDLLNP